MLSIVKDVLTRLYAFLGGSSSAPEMRTSNRRSSSATSGL